MAYRKELCIAGVLLLLSLLQSTQSASFAVTKLAETIAIRKMAELGEDALTYLVDSTSAVLRNHTGSHSVGCIREPKEHERLTCTLLSTFSSYLQNASGLGVDEELSKKLLNIGKRVEYLTAKCNGSLKNTCEEIFQKDEKSYKNLEKVRSILVLYLQWIVKPMECYC